MGKVTFEFDDVEERHDIAVTNERHRLLVALDELDNFAREIYNR